MSAALNVFPRNHNAINPINPNCPQDLTAYLTRWGNKCHLQNDAGMVKSQTISSADTCLTSGSEDDDKLQIQVV